MAHPVIEAKTKPGNFGRELGGVKSTIYSTQVFSTAFVLQIWHDNWFYLWEHPFKASANFHNFWPLPPYHRHSSKMLMKGIFDPYVLWPYKLRTIGRWEHPFPLRHADVLNGWSHIGLFVDMFNLKSLCIWFLIVVSTLKVNIWAAVSQIFTFIDSSKWKKGHQNFDDFWVLTLKKMNS